MNPLSNLSPAELSPVFEAITRIDPKRTRERAKNIRIIAGLTQTELGLRLGYGKTRPASAKWAIACFESGHRGTWTEEFFKRWVEACGG